MKQAYIDKLLANYMADSISESDFLEMRSLVNQMSDEDLAVCLHKAWDRQRVSKDAFESKAATLLPHIQEKLDWEKSTKDFSRRFTLWPRLGKYAAVVAMLMLSASTFYLYQEQHSINEVLAHEVVFSSPTGQRADIVLPDGTEVSMNSHSTLRYKQNFGKDSRELSLSGEAFFKVKKDASKPFIIHSNELQVRVLGTTFNFHNYDSEEYAEITLVEGCVQVNTEDNQVVQLLPNEKATFEKKTNKLTKTYTSLHSELAWRKSQLEFEETPLREVIRTIERCYRVNIIAEEGRWLDDLYSATYKDISLDEILDILKIHYHFNIKRSEDSKNIYLTFSK